MNKLYKFIFSFINISLVFLIGFTFFNSNIQTKTLLVNNANREKLVNSNQMIQKKVVVNVNEVKEQKESNKEITIIDKSCKEDKKKDTNNTEKVKKEENNLRKDTSKKQTNKQETTVKEKIETYAVLESFKGKLAAYGSDCSGCSSKTSSGYDISKSIYYKDKKYGNIRILAGDRKYPYGTIVNLKIDSKTEIKGIVLDRGSDIGMNKKFQFDLLFENQKEAYSFGSKSKVTFEILRLGY